MKSLEEGDTSGGWRSDAKSFGSIVVLSTADYNAPLWTNKQHIASRLVDEVPVLYIESLGLRRPRFNARDLSRMARRISLMLKRGASDSAQPAKASRENLTVVSPVLIPFHSSRWIRKINRRLLERQLAGALAKLPMPRMLWTFSPLAIDVVDLGDYDEVLYHCVDDLSTVPHISAKLVNDLEKRLASRSDHVVVTTPALREKLSRFNPKTSEFHNVVDIEHFSRVAAAAVPDDMAAVSEPRALFIGALSDHKINWKLLVEVSATLPDWSFVMIGPLGEEAKQPDALSAEQRPNIHLFGHREYDDLPDYMSGAKVGLIPYRISEHTNAIFPMKTLEYRAAGLGVVSTPLPGVVEAKSNGLGVSIADNADDFASEIVAASSGSTPDMYAASQTWDTLLDRIFGVVLGQGGRA